MSANAAHDLLYELEFVDHETGKLREDVQVKECPFCGIDDGSVVDTPLTRQALFYSFKKCSSCHLVYPYPRPKREIIESHFQSDEFGRRKRTGAACRSKYQRREKTDRRFWHALVDLLSQPELIERHLTRGGTVAQRDRLHSEVRHPSVHKGP